MSSVSATGLSSQRLTGGQETRPNQTKNDPLAKTSFKGLLGSGEQNAPAKAKEFLDGGGGNLTPIQSFKVPLLREPGGAFDPNDLQGQNVIGCGQKIAFRR